MALLRGVRGRMTIGSVLDLEDDQVAVIGGADGRLGGLGLEQGLGLGGERAGVLERRAGLGVRVPGAGRRVGQRFAGPVVRVAGGRGRGGGGRHDAVVGGRHAQRLDDHGVLLVAAVGGLGVGLGQHDDLVLAGLDHGLRRGHRLGRGGRGRGGGRGRVVVLVAVLGGRGHGYGNLVRREPGSLERGERGERGFLGRRDEDLVLAGGGNVLGLRGRQRHELRHQVRGLRLLELGDVHAVRRQQSGVCVVGLVHVAGLLAIGFGRLHHGHGVRGLRGVVGAGRRGRYVHRGRGGRSRGGRGRGGRGRGRGGRLRRRQVQRRLVRRRGLEHGRDHVGRLALR